jgi:hypothetical protein
MSYTLAPRDHDGIGKGQFVMAVHKLQHLHDATMKHKYGLVPKKRKGCKFRACHYYRSLSTASRQAEDNMRTKLVHYHGAEGHGREHHGGRVSKNLEHMDCPPKGPLIIKVQTNKPVPAPAAVEREQSARWHPIAFPACPTRQWPCLSQGARTLYRPGQ